MNELQMIKDYIDSNDLSYDERIFLISYIVNSGFVEEKPKKVDYSSIVSDLRSLNEHLMGIEETSLVKERVQSELEILNCLLDAASDENKLVDASYKLDRLYYESDMPFRNTDTVLRKIESAKSRGK